MGMACTQLLSLFICAFLFVGETKGQFASYEELCRATHCSHNIQCARFTVYHTMKNCLQCRNLCRILEQGIRSLVVHAIQAAPPLRTAPIAIWHSIPMIDGNNTVNSTYIDTENTTPQTDSIATTNVERTTTPASTTTISTTTTTTTPSPTTSTKPVRRFFDKCRKRFCNKNRTCSNYKRNEVKLACLRCEQYCENTEPTFSESTFPEYCERICADDANVECETELPLENAHPNLYISSHDLCVEGISTNSLTRHRNNALYLVPICGCYLPAPPPPPIYEACIPDWIN